MRHSFPPIQISARYSLWPNWLSPSLDLATHRSSGTLSGCGIYSFCFPVVFADSDHRLLSDTPSGCDGSVLLAAVSEMAKPQGIPLGFKRTEPLFTRSSTD